MSVDGVLARGRAAAVALMTDRVTIREPSTRTYNPATMAYDLTPGATLYTGPADVKPLSGREVQAGEREVALRSFDVRLPFSVGRVLTVTGVGRGGRRNARHLDAEN